MPILRIVLILLLSAVTASASAQSDPRAIQEEDKYVRPILIVAPAFPKSEPTDKLPVEIRVSGSVNVEGVLEAPDFSPTEGNEKFINAIKDVLSLWRFRPAIGKETCMPVVSTGVALVWFEEKDGMPSVSVSMPKWPSAGGVADTKPKNFPRVFVNRPKIEYPFSARRAAMEGATELLFNVNYEGEALQTTVLYSIPNKIFGDAAISGSRRVRFSAGAPDDDVKKNVCIVVPFKYCLQSGASYPLTACR